MKISKLIILFLLICILSILTVSLAGCYRNGNIIIEDCTVKYDGQSHSVVATNDTNGNFTYRYVSKELGYDSEQAPVEVGKYIVTVSKKGYKTAKCTLEITTDFIFYDGCSVTNIIDSDDSVLYVPSKINGKEVKEIGNLVLCNKVKEIYLPSTLEKITYFEVADKTIVYLASIPEMSMDIDLSNILFNVDNVSEYIQAEYFEKYNITRIDILGENFSSIRAVKNIVDTVVDTVYLREDAKLEKSLPSNVKTVVVNYGHEIQNNFLTMQGLIENLILTTDEERILVKSDSFINLTEVTNFIPSKNIYFSDWTRKMDENNLLNSDYYYCDDKKLPKINKLIIEEDVEIIETCQYANVRCDEIILPNILKEVKLWGLAACADKIDLPSSLEIIGDRAFLGSGVTTLKLPDSVKNIGYEAFAYCKKIEGTIILPKNLEYLGKRAFYFCEKINKIIDNSQMKNIMPEAFAFCLALNEFVFNDSLEKIGEAAFLGDGSYQYIYLPDSIKYIETKAFYGAGSRLIIIPEEIVNIEGRAFSWLDGVKSKSPRYTIENGYLIRTEDKFLMSFDETSTTKKVIPEIDINGLCDEVYEWIIDRGQFEGSTLTINSSIKEYKYDKPIMEKGHIVIPEHVTEQPIFNVEVGGGFIYESAVPPKMPDTESLRMDGKEIIVPKGSIDAYKQAFSKYANADELIAKLVEAQ